MNPLWFNYLIVSTIYGQTIEPPQLTACQEKAYLSDTVEQLTVFKPVATGTVTLNGNVRFFSI